MDKQKVVPKKVSWSAELERRFEKAGFTPAIITELKTLGEVYQIEGLTVIARLEALDAQSFEVVWMASLGNGLAKWSKVFFEGAKRNGAKAIRFHIDEEEKPLLRLLKRWKPKHITDEGFNGLVYRVSLEGGNE